MFKYVLSSLKGYKAAYLKDDIIAGFIVAALSIPVSMGYAQIAGLPPVYGLYASILPVVAYALFASSPQLIFGIDASASAITGSALAAMGIALVSDQAMAVAPVLAFYAGLFLVLFAIFRLGRFVDYISTTVMSGFISGVAVSIIVGQVPKVMGIDSSGTDFFPNMKYIITEFLQTNLISVALGAAAIVLIMLGKKFLPKIPVALVVLVLGTLVSALFKLDTYNVVIVGDIPRGLPPFIMPQFWNLSTLPTNIGAGFVIAVVVFADSLLSANSFAIRNNYALNPTRELVGFAASNLMASFTGCSATSSSVSRTAASEQYKGRTQMVSLVAAAIMVLVVAFLAGLLYYMPQPVLSGIVIAALLGVVDMGLLKRLFRRSRSEAVIWLVSAVSVLVVGVLFGVLAGVILSFVDVLARTVSPYSTFLGTIPGKKGFYDLNKNPGAKPVEGVAIYRFSSRLYFANIGIFSKNFREALAQKPQAIVIDGSGINGIDLPAADELRQLAGEAKTAGVPVYIAELTSHVRAQMEGFGIGGLWGEGHSVKTLEGALEAISPGTVPQN